MKRIVPGILLATIAAYFLGFLYWGLNPLPYSVWKRTNDDQAAQQALREHFPESGTYYLPGMYNDEETLSRLSEAGPVGFVHISLEGRPVVQPETMMKGTKRSGTSRLVLIQCRNRFPSTPSIR